MPFSGWRIGVEAMSALFQSGEFRLHSGGTSDFKIDCDALTNAEIAVLATQLVRRLPAFGRVVGIPTGSMRLAERLRSHATTGPLLIVDDVLTTGASMKRVRDGHGDLGAVGAVLFARGPCPSWIVPLFVMTDEYGRQENQ